MDKFQEFYVEIEPGENVFNKDDLLHRLIEKLARQKQPPLDIIRFLEGVPFGNRVTLKIAFKNAEPRIREMEIQGLLEEISEDLYRVKDVMKINYWSNH